MLALLLHRIHARSAFLGGVEDSYYWFVIGEKRTGSDPTYRKSTLQGQGNYDRVEQVAITLRVCS